MLSGYIGLNGMKEKILYFYLTRENELYEGN